MSRFFKYNGTEDLEVIDYDRLKKFIEINKNEDMNGYDLSGLITTKCTANPSENKLDWCVSIGYNKCDKESDFNINNFSPYDCTTQMFFSEIAKCIKPFNLFITDEEFPSINDKQPYAWTIESFEDGHIEIIEILTVLGDKIKNISVLEEFAE